ncbi:sorting nexin-13-like [Watersipora subatra]|uniref:sorting nexin-13-like n=1 Tax=Watersipora subatra TaxID=2589382 RepID=UPI00355B4ACE
MMRDGEAKEGKADNRLTGASNIDEQLQEVIKYIFRDYIDVWYREVSTDSSFPHELRKVLNSAIANFASRAKAIDWTPLLTHKLVDEMASHVKLYRRAYQQERKMNAEESGDGGEEQPATEVIEKYFFEYETEMEEVCREAVSTDQQREIDYLQELTEMLLFFLLPDEEFSQRMFRFIVREVLVQGVIYPLIDRISEPDYVNQYIIWMCYDTTLTNDSFIATLRMSNSIEEVQSVLTKVKEDMSRTRSKDTGGVDDSSIKQTLSSLSYLQRVCESQITRIATKPGAEEQRADIVDTPVDMLIKSLPNKNLPLVFVLTNELGIQYYNDFLLCSEREIYLNMLIDIESFTKELSQHLDDKNEALSFFLHMVGDIYDKYFSEPVSTLEVDPGCVEPVVTALRDKTFNTSVFDALHDAIMEKLEKFYEAFKKHELYIKMLREMDLDIGCSLSEDSYDASAAADTITEGGPQAPESKITATIVKTGIAKEKGLGSVYAVYSIQVRESVIATGAVRKWQTTRRYSDFYDLYILLCDKYVALRDFPFPGKRTFNNLSTEFLEKRALALTQYMQMVLDSETYQLHTGLQQIMRDFLNIELWDKPKNLSHRKVGTLMFRPLKQSVKQMGTKFKAVPGDVIDGFGKMFTKLNFVPSMGKGQLDSYKVGASLDTEDDDNIPMRIMLLLLDEVFDLREKNQWLRRRVVAILRQIVKATYGDRINRKIVDHVEMLTSADQVAEYIRKFKEQLWPSGMPAEPSPTRSEDTRLRTAVVCKAKMIGSVPDELRHLIGTETTRAGLMRVYSMFQHKSLNKRLLYVMLESVLQTLLPQNPLDKVFRQIHRRSARSRADSSLSQTVP